MDLVLSCFVPFHQDSVIGPFPFFQHLLSHTRFMSFFEGQIIIKTLALPLPELETALRKLY